MTVTHRAADDFKPFKRNLKKIHILADNMWLENALFTRISECLSVCLLKLIFSVFCCISNVYKICAFADNTDLAFKTIFLFCSLGDT